MTATPSWWTQATPIGDLGVVAVGGTVVRVALPGADLDPGPGARPGRDERIAAQLDEYFAGRRTRFDVPVALDAVPGEFRRRVLATLAAGVGHGETVTYGELAAMAGRPGASRAVGGAMAANPVPILVPCHRVVAAGGRIGGYGGGLGTKRALLALEGVAVG